jgi:hypothetical protein
MSSSDRSRRPTGARRRDSDRPSSRTDVPWDRAFGPQLRRLQITSPERVEVTIAEGGGFEPRRPLRGARVPDGTVAGAGFSFIRVPSCRRSRPWCASGVDWDDQRRRPRRTLRPECEASAAGTIEHLLRLESARRGEGTASGVSPSGKTVRATDFAVVKIKKPVQPSFLAG